MRQQSSFIGFDFDAVWAIDPSYNNGYPYFKKIPPPGYDPSKTAITLDTTATNVIVGDQILISGTFTSKTETPRPDTISLSCSDPTAVTFDAMSISGSKENATFTFMATFNKEGQHIITALSVDGASDSVLITVLGEDDNDPYMSAVRYIMDNGKLVDTYWLSYDYWHGEGRGSAFSVFRIEKGRVTRVGDDNFSVVSQNADTDYLIQIGSDNVPRLVTNAETLQKIWFTHYINSQSNSLIFYMLQSIQDNANRKESTYQQELSKYQLIDTYVEFAKTEIGLIYNAIYGNPVTTLTNFYRDQVLKSDSSQQNVSARVRTQHILRASSNNALRDLNTLLNNLQTDLAGTGGRVIDYETAMAIKEVVYLETVHNEYHRMDIKYLRAENKSIFSHFTFNDFMDIFGVANKRFIKIDGIDDWIKVEKSFYKGVTIITTATETHNDPDLDAMGANIDRANKSFSQQVYDPSYENKWGNNALFIPASQSKSVGLRSVGFSLFSEGSNSFDQAIVIISPVDIAVFSRTGELIGKVINGDAEYNSDIDAENPLIIVVEDGYRVLIFPNENDYRIDITATEVDIMTYLEFRVDGEGNYVSQTVLYGVCIEHGDVFSINPSGNATTDYSRLLVDDASINIIVNATAASGGLVYANGIGYVIGDTVQLLAAPDDDFNFSGWYENGVKIPNAEFMYEFTATVDRAIEARFIPAEPTTYTINATAGAGGSVSGGGTYNADATVALTATPDSNYTFDGWYENNVRLSDAGPSYIFTATADRTLEARFIYSGVGLTDAQAVAADKASLSWDSIRGTNTTQDAVTVNLASLPATGANNTNITWASTNSAISTTGVVTRPDYGAGNSSGRLSATITKGEATGTAFFDLVVLEQPMSDAQAVAAAKAALTWESIRNKNTDQNSITANLVLLPTSGANGAVIVWTSTNSAVATDGTVIRPINGAGNATGNLTATISKGAAVDSVVFNLTVIELPITLTDAQAVAADKAALTWSIIADGNSAVNNVLVNLAALPSNGANGTTITWASNNIAVISNSGAVTRPAHGSGDATVTFTATITKGIATDSVVFNLTVKEMPTTLTDAEKVAADKATLTWDVIKSNNTAQSSVTSNLTLPTTGISGSTITWSSSVPATISNSGTVTRPTHNASNQTVTLIATIVSGNESDTITFALIVIAQPYTPPYIPPTTTNPPDTVVPDTQPPLAGGWVNPYSDVADTDWFYEAVQFVTESGLMEGTGASKFSPSTTLTRAMIVTVLYRLEGKPAVTGNIPFPDVKPDEWYSDPILWANQNEIVYGYSNGKFGWNDPVTREQAVTLLYRYAKAKGMDVSASADLSKFVDANKISDWALDAMKWAVAVGIVQGRPGNKTAPGDTSTRAEVAMIFKRYIEDFLGEGEDSGE